MLSTSTPAPARTPRNWSSNLVGCCPRQRQCQPGRLGTGRPIWWHAVHVNASASQDASELVVQSGGMLSTSTPALARMPRNWSSNLVGCCPRQRQCQPGCLGTGRPIWWDAVHVNASASQDASELVVQSGGMLSTSTPAPARMPRNWSTRVLICSSPKSVNRRS